MKTMVRALTVFVLMLFLTAEAPVAQGKVIYSGNAEKFIFRTDSVYSPTDLFSKFKDVMPGDVLTQTITVKNDAEEKIKVKIYLRSLGADQASAEFLSKLNLSVRVHREDGMEELFELSEEAMARPTDWFCLGTVCPDGEVDLDIILTVPTELGNSFQNQIGCLDWEFMAEELPTEQDGPMPPAGDGFQTEPWLLAAICFGVVALTVFLWGGSKRKEKAHDNAY